MSSPEPVQVAAPTRPHRSVLEVENLAVTFRTAGKGEFPALRDVSLTLHAGEILGIVGESGSGKTTLGRCITGFIPPTSGTVTVDLPGIAESRTPSVGRAGVQMVFQEASTSLNPRLPLWRSVAEALSGGHSIGRGHREPAIAELMRVGLTRDQALKRPAEVSGGQRQRAAIARALASGAQILVCDEAVASLDVSVRARILNLLQRLRREQGTSIVFISHDMGIVAHLADRIVVMKEGRVEEIGTSEEVIGSPTRQYTRDLVAAIPRLEREG